MKPCPFCTEQIQDDAIKCRFCGEFFENKSQEQLAHKTLNQSVAPAIQKKVTVKKGKKKFIFLFLVGVVPFLWPLLGVTLDTEVEIETWKGAPEFSIWNKNDFDWENCELKINAGIFGTGGYVLKAEKIPYEKTYRQHRAKSSGFTRISAYRFAKGNGTRYDPVAVKPKSFSISCSTSKGRGTWKGNFKD